MQRAEAPGTLLGCCSCAVRTTSTLGPLSPPREHPLPRPPDRKPFQVKDSSEVEASTTPPMMGTRAATTGSVGFSPRNIADSSTARGRAGGGAKASAACHVAGRPDARQVQQLVG